MPPRPINVEHSPRPTGREPKVQPDTAKPGYRDSSLPRVPSGEARHERRPPSSDHSSSPRVHWPDDPADPRREQARGRRSERRMSDQTDSRRRSSTRSQSREVYKRDYHRSAPEHPIDKDEKPWFKKKTVWTTVASLATVAALVPSAMSANASADAAHAAGRAARNTRRAAAAGEQSARASMLSARAVNNTTMAQGHQDCYGRYTGPTRHVRALPRYPAHSNSSSRRIAW